MNLTIIFLLLLSIYNSLALSKYKEKLSTVLIAINVRNKAHVLPYFLSYLENWHYPKSRLALFIRSDHNDDNSIELIKIWLKRTSHLYHHVDFEYEEYLLKYKNEFSATDWPKERFAHIIDLKERAFDKAEELWSDFIFFIDCDAILANSNTLKELVSFKLPIVAPMLVSERTYSNFWGGMTYDYYYSRTNEYIEIYKGEKIGNFQVPMVHSAVLINLRYTNSLSLTFDNEKLIDNQRQLGLKNKLYDGPFDDIIIFAISANSSGTPMFISNTLYYGYISIPLGKNDKIEKDLEQLRNTKISIIDDSETEILVNPVFDKFINYPKKHKLSLDHVYMINLDRRPERKYRMNLIFEELGLEVERFSAVDGKQLSIGKLDEMGIHVLPMYRDPRDGRPMTMGEVGCFLSHYRIWEKIIELNQKEVLILEDDVRFLPGFLENTRDIINQARKIDNWDFIYFGRKIMEGGEQFVSENLVSAHYSLWTVGYIITLDGAKKLVNERPLKKIIPIDEYIPIMYDHHPNEEWSKAYQKKNLISLSASPRLLKPIRFHYQEGYVTDTEDSEYTKMM